jgi:molybdate transport system substrate-binding protein
MKTLIRTAALLLGLLSIGLRPVAAADPATLSIAAAANLTYALGSLDAAFARAHPEIRITSSTGASGSLVAQITHGAPYDVFLSADLGFAQKLVKAGGGDASSLRTFAIGRLVLWTTRPGLSLGSVESVVRDPAVERLAIANPATAPYGLAAVQALGKLGLAEAARPKLVQGENISQAASFVESGNADAGFVALSLVLSPNLKDPGRWIEVPEDLYEPLGQAAVLTTRGAANPAARAYLDFLGTEEAGKILEKFGYRIPR